MTQEELKRRNLSGIYIFDQFPGEKKATPTCIEDCSQVKRREWCMAQNKDALRKTISLIVDTFKEMCEYLHGEGCVSERQKIDFCAMANRIKENSKANWGSHELADLVDFASEKVRLLADACGVMKANPVGDED